MLMVETMNRDAGVASMCTAAVAVTHLASEQMAVVL
jgi:hypothetical protein